MKKHIITLKLVRDYNERGTNSELMLDNWLICNTIELPWRGNQRNISCIPEGRYLLQMYASSKFGIVPLVRDVEGRSGILFHAANDALKELRGCIAPVTRITDWGRGNESKKALTEVIKIVKHTEETNGECWIDITSRKGYPVIV